MNCKRVSSILSGYVDGNLADPTSSEVESHLQGCEVCSAELRKMKGMVAALASMGRMQSPLDCWPGVRDRIEAPSAAGLHWWGWITRPVVFAPAALVIALLALMLARPLTSPHSVPDKALVSEYGYYIGAHSELQRRQPFADPDTVFIMGELQKASLVTEQ